jgi:hypothetical protein
MEALHSRINSPRFDSSNCRLGDSRAFRQFALAKPSSDPRACEQCPSHGCSRVEIPNHFHDGMIAHVLSHPPHTSAGSHGDQSSFPTVHCANVMSTVPTNLFWSSQRSSHEFNVESISEYIDGSSISSKQQIWTVTDLHGPSGNTPKVPGSKPRRPLGVVNACNDGCSVFNDRHSPCVPEVSAARNCSVAPLRPSPP